MRQRGGRMKNERKWRERGFLFSVWVYPVILFAVLYVYINFNSILLSFKTLDFDTQQYVWYGFGNFSKFVTDVFTEEMLSRMFGNSIVIYLVNLFINLPIQIMVSFFLYKKIYGSEIFKVLLFLPSLISSIVWVMLFRYMVEEGIPVLLGNLGLDSSVNFLGDNTIAFGTMIFYNSWIGFSGGMLIFLGSMSRIPSSLVEAGKLDGMSVMRELIYIVLPLIYPVISVSLVTSIPGFFTNSLSIYAFYEAGANYRLYTFGYYLFIQVIGKNANVANYPYAAAGGVLLTLVVAPITLLVKRLVEKLDPGASY